MSNFRVSKIKNNQYDSLESKPFDDFDQAEHYAKTASQGDEDHFYVIEVKVGDDDEDEDDYDDVEYYVNGELGTKF